MRDYKCKGRRQLWLISSDKETAASAAYASTLTGPIAKTAYYGAVATGNTINAMKRTGHIN